MGNGIKKGHLHSGLPLRNGSRFAKAAGPLILLFLIFGRLPALESESIWMRDTGISMMGVRFDGLNAGMSEWNVFFQSFAGTEFRLDYRLLAGFTWLGEFQFADSEDFAYRDVRKTDGYGFHTVVGAVLNWPGWFAELEAGIESVSIGSEYSEWGFVLGALLGMNTCIGEFSANARRIGEDAAFGLKYVFDGQLGKAGVRLEGSFERNANSVIGTKVSLMNFSRDLKVGALFRFGLDFPVYKTFGVEIEKTAGSLKWTFGFYPSAVENCLASAGLAWIFGENARKSTVLE